MNSDAIPKIINVIDKPVLKREFMLEASVAVTTSQCCATDTMQKTAKITSAAIKYLEIFLIFYLLKKPSVSSAVYCNSTYQADYRNNDNDDSDCTANFYHRQQNGIKEFFAERVPEEKRDKRT